MENLQTKVNYHPITGNHLHLIHGGGGYADKIIWYIIFNWGEIHDGFRDGFNAYHEKK